MRGLLVHPDETAWPSGESRKGRHKQVSSRTVLSLWITWAGIAIVPIEAPTLRGNRLISHLFIWGMLAAVVQPGKISGCHPDDPGSNPGGRTSPQITVWPDQSISNISRVSVPYVPHPKNVKGITVPPFRLLNEILERCNVLELSISRCYPSNKNTRKQEQQSVRFIHLSYRRDIIILKNLSISMNKLIFRIYLNLNYNYIKS